MKKGLQILNFEKLLKGKKSNIFVYVAQLAIKQSLSDLKKVQMKIVKQLTQLYDSNSI